MNKIEEIENNTKKILESGFIEAFIDNYVENRDFIENENTRLMYLMCKDVEEKKVVTLNQIDKIKSIVKDSGFNTLSFAYVDDMKRNLKLEESNSWINRFSDEFKDNIVNFQIITYFFEKSFRLNDERFSNEVEIALFQEHYEHDSYLRDKPLIKDVNILLEKEEELIEDIFYLIEDYQKNEYWDIDILSFEHYRNYNTSIDILFKLSELLFQLKQLSMYNEFLEIANNESFDDVKQVNNSDKTNLIDDLLIFSNTVLKVNVLNFSKEQIISFDKQNNYSDYLDYENYVFQTSIIKADVKQINLILGNLERAIKTNCFNSIDLRDTKLNENFYYSDLGETIPEDLQEFRIQYLKYLVTDLRKIDFNIRKILNLPIVQHKEFIKRDILKEFDNYSKFESDYLIKIKDVLKVDKDKLEIYFKEYLEKTDSFLQLFDEMQNSFYSDVGYYNEKDKNLKDILKGCKSLLISNLFEIINAKSINNYDKNILDKVIKDYEFSLKVYETKSNFIDLIKIKLDEILIDLDENNYKNNEISISSSKKIPVKFYVLTYILDCRANNDKIELKKSSLIIIGNELLKNETTKGLTFYRVFNDYYNIVKNILEDNPYGKKISTHFDLDWKDIVLQLSKNKDILQKYILDKKLV